LPETNASSSRIARKKGNVVEIPSTLNSASARPSRVRASSLSTPLTMSLANSGS
jgi:hypothetical protein